MSLSASCDTCRWWDWLPDETGPDDGVECRFGLCRKNPPVADERDKSAVWPVTEDDDWCASYAIDELVAGRRH